MQDPFSDAQLIQIVEDARVRGDEQTARLASALRWAADFCDQRLDQLRALAREVRKNVPMENLSDALRDALAEILDGEDADAKATVRFEGARVEVENACWPLRVLVQGLSRMCEKAPNFVTAEVSTPDGVYRVTVQKPSGKSPAEVIADLKDKLEEMRSAK